VVGRPLGILADLQGPKLRVGKFADGPVTLKAGQAFRFDNDPTPGDETRVHLPHPEILVAMRPGATLLLDDGKLRMTVTDAGPGYANTKVVNGGKLSERKGVAVPDVVIPMSPLTPKDREDLAFALRLGVDWIALSFVQAPRTWPSCAASSKAAPPCWPRSRSPRRWKCWARSSTSATA
jgi:pyruvate kinase